MASLDFSVVSCVSDFSVFETVLGASVRASPKDPAMEVVTMDNTGNRYSAPMALNLGMDRSNGRVIIFCHQDVILPRGWAGQLADQIAAVQQRPGSWGVLGVFGTTWSGRMVGHIRDPHGYRKWGRLPCRVHTLDEVCLVIRRDSGLRFDDGLGGFHFYGADICLQAHQRGLSCYAVDACLEHLSGGKTDASFREMAWRFERKWRGMPDGPLTVETTCGVFRTQTGVQATVAELFVRLRRKVRRRLARVGLGDRQDTRFCDE